MGKVKGLSRALAVGKFLLYIRFYSSCSVPSEAQNYSWTCLHLLVNYKLLGRSTASNPQLIPQSAWCTVAVQLKHPESNGREAPREEIPCLSLPASLLPASQVPVGMCDGQAWPLEQNVPGDPGQGTKLSSGGKAGQLLHARGPIFCLLGRQ